VAYEMRNAVAHGYFKVDLGIVWKTIHADLRDVKIRLKSVISTMGASYFSEQFTMRSETKSNTHNGGDGLNDRIDFIISRPHSYRLCLEQELYETVHSEIIRLLDQVGLSGNYEELAAQLLNEIRDCRIWQYESGASESDFTRNIEWLWCKQKAEIRDLVASIKDEKLKGEVIRAFQELDAVELRIEQYIQINLERSIEKLLTEDWRRRLLSFALALAAGFLFYIISDKIIMSSIALIILWYESRVKSLERSLKLAQLLAQKKTAEENYAAKKKRILEESVFGLPGWLI
jgi:hypothetical protein